jgi:cyclophilin family peptidyl-prolyl cis-trans isomerase
MKPLLLLLGLLFAVAPRPSFAADPPPAAAPAGATSSPAAGAKDKGKDKPAASAAHIPSPQVVVVTSLGSFTIELNAERAPLTVANFLKYVDQGHYTNTIFHRVIANFVIQGGGFDTDSLAKPTPYKVVNESGNGLTNQRGTVGMARGQEPHSSDAQFYVNLYDNEALDPNKTRWGYAVFGTVVQGMEVVDKIGNVATGSHGPFKEDAPLQTVVIQKIERVGGP